MICHFILYVSDQKKSTTFYEAALGLKPTLFVPGMTEFKLSEDCILGLMPSVGIKKLLGQSIQDPENARGIPRTEVYLRVLDPESAFQRAVSAGAKSLSPVQKRNWGMAAGYLEDPDGHILAFSN